MKPYRQQPYRQQEDQQERRVEQTRVLTPNQVIDRMLVAGAILVFSLWRTNPPWTFPLGRWRP